MKCQNLFSEKNVMNLLSAEVAKRVVKVEAFSDDDMTLINNWLLFTDYTML